MRRIHVYGSAVLACAAIGLTAWGATPRQQPQPPAWEYKAIFQTNYPGYLERDFNELGAEGWEYCGAHQAPSVGDADAPPRLVTVCVFKRLKAAAGK